MILCNIHLIFVHFYISVHNSSFFGAFFFQTFCLKTHLLDFYHFSCSYKHFCSYFDFFPFSHLVRKIKKNRFSELLCSENLLNLRMEPAAPRCLPKRSHSARSSGSAGPCPVPAPLFSERIPEKNTDWLSVRHAAALRAEDPLCLNRTFCPMKKALKCFKGVGCLPQPTPLVLLYCIETGHQRTASPPI